MRSRWVPIALALWTLFVWGTRIKNADGSVVVILLSLTFVAGALLVLATKGHALPTVMLAGWTVVVWLVRIPDIVFFSPERSTAFKLVHVAIGLVSMALAGACDGAVNGRVRRAARPTPG
ncbi:MAG: hypothetical protein M3527_07250 [Actinomycetota bacterium]|nr:hypothetical protein [Acidimicrobiia bacterium]MDQ3294229.1 hypothetical protein [Actinomycetota bacterium]